ncbi:putative phage tail protein [Porcincola intestinalis]|uniref:DUF2313 domain-containing protein n=1 Tax=Porcincola intestinalis TaxID=2606632 RepID=A0A6L5X2C6_9FIRM|nr:putative phage tail protein [Porcincola intestinalis]MDY5579947.1 putative phage tail protein [Porcincola intestinalis]MSS13627.1 DUF2313 domain-containing protein [Porcincola intestinalis]
MIDLYDYEDKTPHKELLEQWGPSYWKEFREMEANYTFAGWTLDLMQYQVYRMVNNLFIATCDEQTLAKYEGIFGITPAKGQSLESRRQIAALRSIGRQKVSFSSMKQYIKDMTGTAPDIAWDKDNRLILRIQIPSADDNEIPFGSIQNVLSKKATGHIKLLFSQLVVFQIADQEKISYGLTIRMPMRWWQDAMLDGQYDMDGQIPMDQERGPYETLIVRNRIENDEPDIGLSIWRGHSYTMNGYANMDGSLTMEGNHEML